MKIKTVGSICSGIEAASVAWAPLGMEFFWFSEIADYPSKVLSHKYPKIKNVGDMNYIPEMLKQKKIKCPDMLCAGTPCQAFSFAGLRQGLNDARGNLCLKFVDICNTNDERRIEEGNPRSIIFWENVEGVLSDKTNAFGCLISALAGFDNPLTYKKWPSAGLLRGKFRNIAWRVLDARYFGVPQQRKRLYLIAGGTDFYPENILFEDCFADYKEPNYNLRFEKNGVNFEIFRGYTDCLYSAYGTKWNGNAPATNGSLFIAENGRIRRLMPLETERLMGFPDNYTYLPKCRNTPRFQCTGNSWVVPVVQQLGKKIIAHADDSSSLYYDRLTLNNKYNHPDFKDCFLLDKKFNSDKLFNSTEIPANPKFGFLKDIVEVCDDSSLFISPVGCHGMIRRKIEKNLNMNPRLEQILSNISNEMSSEEIEKRSKIQKRGRFSK